MSHLGQRARVAGLVVLSALFALSALPRRTHAAWGVEPVEVHATPAYSTTVEVCTDGQNGAIVVWHELFGNGGWLRARHLLASGDVDPAWPSPALVCDREAARVEVGAVGDGNGGAYVWWIENLSLYLSRLAPNGQVAPGWLAGGRKLGDLLASKFRPIAVSDGAGGLYIGWLSLPVPVPNLWQFHIRVLRLGPDGAAVGGWPTSGRGFGLATGDYPFVVSFGMDGSADGGLWLAWQAVDSPDFQPLDGEVRALRLAPSGLPVAGWTTEGVYLEPYDASYVRTLDDGWSTPVAHTQIAVASDGGDGAFVLTSRVVPGPDLTLFTCPIILRRLDGSGTPPPGWAAEGLTVGEILESAGSDHLMNSIYAGSDGRKGVYTGSPLYFTDTPPWAGYDHRDGVGALVPGAFDGGLQGVELAPSGDGGMFHASYKPDGPGSIWDTDAYVGVKLNLPSASFWDTKWSSHMTRYGDVGLAATGDGGAIFAWSQFIDRQGVYAIRLNPGGQVTGVPPGTAARGLRVWYARGSGVQVYGATGPMTLRLHDLTGREVASGESADAGEWTVPGTEGLPSGMYFAKAVADGRELRAKVVVVR